MKESKVFLRVVPVVALFLLVGIVLNLTYIQRFNTKMLIQPLANELFDPSMWINLLAGKQRDPNNKVYEITWFNPPFDFLIWPKALYGGFKSCKYANCIMSFGRNRINESDAIIFDGRFVQPKDFFERKFGQIWIYSTIEAPPYQRIAGGHWMRGKWAYGFNWTMNYDKYNSDIYLPYGEIRKRVGQPKQVNYSAIFRMKSKTALIVQSNCNALSERGKFLKLLGRFLEIDVLGYCGRKWECQKTSKHEDCFQIVNKYKFYLAFENSFCDQYFTEKIYGNFNFDSLIVIRGGRTNETRRMFPPGTYISTDDFHSVRDLANYLNKVANSEEIYTKLLKQKNMYFSIPYEMVYQRAMCQLCEMMNKQSKYRRQNRHMGEWDWAYGHQACQKAQDLNKI